MLAYASIQFFKISESNIFEPCTGTICLVPADFDGCGSPRSIPWLQKSRSNNSKSSNAADSSGNYMGFIIKQRRAEAL